MRNQWSNHACAASLCHPTIRRVYSRPSLQQDVASLFSTFLFLYMFLVLQVTPPDVLAAESLVDMAASQGWKLDRSFYGSVSSFSFF